MNGHFNAPAWPQIERYLNERLSRCREKNDTSLNPLETAQLRGEIKALKELLALPEQWAARVVIDNPGYGTDSLD